MRGAMVVVGVLNTISVTIAIFGARDPTFVTRTTGLACNGLWIPFVWVLLAVIYRELRLAREGIDSDQIAAVFA
jgi:hypothetical protein